MLGANFVWGPPAARASDALVPARQNTNKPPAVVSPNRGNPREHNIGIDSPGFTTLHSFERAFQARSGPSVKLQSDYGILIIALPPRDRASARV